MRIAASLVSAMALLAVPGQSQQPGKIDVQVVSYDGLKDLVLKNRGKVVVVDFWSTSCIPCLKNMPHMVEMQHRFAKDGLVTITVSCDKLDADIKTEADRKQLVLESLTRKKADLVNVILDESWKLAEDKLRISALPGVYVFSRDGKWVQFGGQQGKGVEPAAVEKLVVQFLQQK
ncbi:MAG: TlpA family protein disulfide reductase [Planctomycetes bacterium]|nr:TlpA family protein disulfide reductase [Planctomycetota bacterium]